jgi:hypothetical protein
MSTRSCLPPLSPSGGESAHRLRLEPESSQQSMQCQTTFGWMQKNFVDPFWYSLVSSGPASITPSSLDKPPAPLKVTTIESDDNTAKQHGSVDRNISVECTAIWPQRIPENDLHWDHAHLRKGLPYSRHTKRLASSRMPISCDGVKRPRSQACRCWSVQHE